MKVILLSGGSGKRLWPLSNDARAKQFLKMLPAPDGDKESMMQRIVRQIRQANLADEIIVTTRSSHRDAIELQLGSLVTMVIEPAQRHTFPAIALACSHLAANGCDPNEPILVMPCDSFVNLDYYQSLSQMAEVVASGQADLALLGVPPVHPSTKYGYILPSSNEPISPVKHFKEKPYVEEAQKLIAQGALWNCGVFAFRLEFLLKFIQKVMPGATLDTLLARYAQLPLASFDCVVAERIDSIAVVRYNGQWKDLGTWNTLTDELQDRVHGNVKTDSCSNTYIVNELGTPLVVIGAKDLVIAATPDGLLVSDRKMSENLKYMVDDIHTRPMFETRRWGKYNVIDSVEYPDGYCALTKRLTLNPGKNISYQRHSCRDELWTFVDGDGEIVLDGQRKPVHRGDVINIPRGMMHGLRAFTPLTFIEVQSGTNLIEEDIERFPFTW